MPERLELQVVLPATESIGPFWIDAAARRPTGTPFSDLPVVGVSATPEETLRAVLGRAGDCAETEAEAALRHQEASGERHDDPDDEPPGD